MTFALTLQNFPSVDIAVDGKSILKPLSFSMLKNVGWSLTLLSRENLSYASTCQTVGLNTGWLMSFTVFLALNSEEFRYTSSSTDCICGLLKVAQYSAKWGTPVLTLGTYLRFWSIVCFGVTMWLILVQKEVGFAISSQLTSCQRFPLSASRTS
jgi:Acetyl-coenzyme A transporter 1